MPVILISLILLLVPPVGASFDAASKGTVSAGFLRFGGGARGASMGEAYTAVVDGADAVFWNPASLRRVDRRAATFMHAAYIASTYYDYGSYAQNLGDSGAFGIGFQYFSAGYIRETDVTGADIGKFSPHDLALSFGYAMPVHDFELGFALKYVRSAVLDTAKTLTSDVGVVSPAVCDGKLRFAAVVDNIGGALKYEEEMEKLPLVVKLGAAYVSDGFGLFSMDVGFPQDSDPYFAMGAEYAIPVSGSVGVSARCGVNSRTIGDIKGFSGASFGFGVDYKMHAFDYSFSPLGDLGSVHSISVSVRF